MNPTKSQTIKLPRNIRRLLRREENLPKIRTSSKVFKSWVKQNKLSEKAYQEGAVLWMLYHEQCKLPVTGSRGGILADEMGLGKTIVMIGLMKSNPKESTLIVLPLSLIAQWKNMLMQLLPEQEVGIYHGGEMSLDTSIVLTTYGMILNRGRKKAIHKKAWGRVIFDEAHNLRSKGRNSGARKLESKIFWMLTGTPMQNYLYDLELLMNVLRLTFIRSPLEERYDLLAHHLLRRKKEEVGLILPPLKEYNIPVEWNNKDEEEIAAQIHSYLPFTDTNVQGIDQIISQLNGGTLPMCVRARQMCTFPKMLKKKIKKMKADGEIPANILLRGMGPGSKMKAVLSLLEKRSNKQRRKDKLEPNRKIVFCHYRLEMDLLYEILNRMGIPTARIDGKVSKEERACLVTPPMSFPKFRLVCKRWNNLPGDLWPIVESFLAPEVLLVQVRTGCDGLNLQHFHEVYFTSPSWNPNVEDQAVGRAHRIGQKSTVSVFRFEMGSFGGSTKSLDQYCTVVQRRKNELAEKVFTNIKKAQNR